MHSPRRSENVFFVRTTSYTEHFLAAEEASDVQVVSVGREALVVSAEEAAEVESAF